MATFYLDYEGGNDANNGTTFALRWKTINAGATTARIAPGDIIRIMGSPAPTSLGVDATWTDLSATVTLSGAVTQTISTCESSWTASTNVTTTTSTDRKLLTVSSSIAPNATFTTGKAARESFSALDLSAYQQVSFWIKQTAGTTAIAGDISLRLCSDTTGDTTVNTINIPGLVVNNRWVPITVNTGGALGSSIQSVALYIDTDRGAQTFLLDNIIAVKSTASADSLSLTSLLGKPHSTGAGGDDTETWYCLRSINGTTVILETGPNTSAATASRGYAGTSETVTGYKRETIKTTMVTAATTDVQAVQDSGTDGNVITFSGGWDRTDMSTQTLETWFDGQNGFGDGIEFATRSFITMTKVGGVRYDDAFSHSSATNLNLDTIGANNNSTYGLNIGLITAITARNMLDIHAANNNGTSGLNLALATRNNTVTSITANNNGGTGAAAGGIICLGQQNRFSNVNARNNASFAVNLAVTTGNLDNATENMFYDISTSNNTTAALQIAGKNYFRNATFGESTEASIPTTYTDSRVLIQNPDNVSGTFLIYCDGGNITTDTTTVHTTGTSWKMSPTNAIRTSNYPLELSLGRIVVSANYPAIVKVWTRRDNTGLTTRVIAKGGQLNGVSSDVSATITAAADTWEQLSITFTPTESGSIEIIGQAWGGTTFNGWWDDMSISQG